MGNRHDNASTRPQPRVQRADNVPVVPTPALVVVLFQLASWEGDRPCRARKLRDNEKNCRKILTKE